mgnify:CR=1 FL=1
MEDIIKDEILGELDFQDDSWVGELDTPFLNSDGNLLFVVQDTNKEGILGVGMEKRKSKIWSSFSIYLLSFSMSAHF